MNHKIVNFSVIIPTLNRTKSLTETIQSISNQDVQPVEIIVIDASQYFAILSKDSFPSLKSKIIHKQTIATGAAIQRNQGIKIASSEIIGFFDDDIILEKDCIRKLWEGLHSNLNCGGINAMIINQKYYPPGNISKNLFKYLSGKKQNNYAGKCFGPAFNLLPEDNPDLPEYQEVEWLNTTCVIYRKEALPNPVFESHFTGYSLMEDLALSLRVAKKWKLLNARTARIFHDSQPSLEKNNTKTISEMELVNRFYIMKNIMNKSAPSDLLKLFIQQLFGGIASKNIYYLDFWKGKLSALKKLRHI